MTTKIVANSMAASRSMSRRAGLQVCCRQQAARPSTPSIPSAPPAARNFSSSRQPRFLNDLAKILGEAAPKGSGSSAQPTRYKDSKVLNYTPTELYAIVSDVDSYSEFLPFCTESKVIGPAPEASAAGASTSTPTSSRPDKRVHAQLGVGFKSFREKYTSLVEMKEAEWVAATALPHHLFQHLSTRWKFVPVSQSSSGQPSTRIDFSLDYAFTSPLYNAVAGGIFAELSKRMMVSFEERATQLYGQRR